MTHEQFITLETAKLAKQAGFDWEINMQYYHTTVGWQLRNIRDIPEFIKGNDRCISCPTQSVLQRWLREIHHLHITIFSSSQESWMFRITKPHQKLEDGVLERISLLTKLPSKLQNRNI